MEDRMKNSSMKTAPNGSTPPTNRETWLHVPHLLRHLSRDLVDAHRELHARAEVAEVRAKEDERHRDAEPQHKQREHGAERHRARRFLPPDEEVEDEEDAEDGAWEQARCEQNVLLPVDTLQRLVKEG